MNTKIRLLQLGKKQVDLIEVLRSRGFSSMTPPTLSSIINRRDNGPLAQDVREEIDRILDEWEKEING